MANNAEILASLSKLEKSSKIAIPLSLLAFFAIVAMSYISAKELQSTRLQITQAEEQLNKRQADLGTLEQKYAELKQRAEAVQKDLTEMSDKLSMAAQKQTPNPATSQTLKELQQDINAADIELRTALPIELTSVSNATLDGVIEKLFSPTASVRGTAYNELMARFSKNPELVPRLLDYAKRNIENPNGVYNTLVVLSHLDHRTLGSNIESIQAFGAKARTLGPKTSERVDKLFQRLPN